MLFEIENTCFNQFFFFFLYIRIILKKFKDRYIDKNEHAIIIKNECKIIYKIINTHILHEITEKESKN